MQKIQKIISQVALLGILLIGFSGCDDCIKGEGATQSQVRNLPEVTGVELNFSGKIYIEQGETQEIIIEAQENILESMETRVSGGILRFGFADCLRSHKEIIVRMTLPTINYAKVSGSGKIESTNTWTVEDCQIEVSGSGDFEGNLNAQKIDTKISGSGGINLIGTTENLNFDLSGSGNLNALNLTTQNCGVKISGSGKAKVAVEKSLDITISGSGDVEYKGNPTVSQDISGSGSVRKLD